MLVKYINGQYQVITKVYDEVIEIFPRVPMDYEKLGCEVANPSKSELDNPTLYLVHPSMIIENWDELMRGEYN